ncbi:hypothetical protein [Streptococcus sp. S784/96/1]|uniref:hypothetical protein n=1 Tax=Streptococcus sp. S784/96/1 TaxID=2653499 RepID=UPI00138758A2|nr:hypothetical protein [Streptococcus sp. S784/96/1]
MEKQEVTFNQSDWSNEEKATTKKVTTTGILGQLFGWLLRAVLFVIATPFYIVIWTINFIKSLFGMFIMWIVGKVCLVVFSGLVEYFVMMIGLADKEMGTGWTMRLMDFLFKTNSQPAFFPYGAIEYRAIVIFALIIATFSTIYRDEL